ncbi:uncharacterized protein LOC115964931 [Quercus lobata]|uniref:uncharacterized protein LOC115964931 n=1 Tax=Quercus lobata TaxID=97700 RepID=UPI001249047C|nr:uncharacterized protein LOC115964931 [Quercus lobata]
MHDRETLKAYLDKYWETYNEMEDNFDDVAIITFKNSLPADHGLRKSLTSKPTTSVRQLMDWINKYKRVEEDQLQGRGKEKVIPQEKRDFKSDQYSSNCLRRDFVGRPETTNAQSVNAVFQEPIHRVLEKIKNEPYFKWPSKMAREPSKRDQNLYCQYHQDHGHSTENYKNLWNHLDQLVQEGRLKHLLYHSSGHQGPQEARRDAALRPPTGMINVILAAPGRAGTHLTQVLSVAQLSTEESQLGPKRARMSFHPVLSFSKEDKIGTIQPHDDTLLITLRIGDYDVKRVMVDGGSAAEVMYPNLYKGLGLKLEDLTPYNSPLIRFDGKLVIPMGMIKLPIQTGLEIVEVNFIMVDNSPYTAIEKEELIEFLKRNIDVFAWDAYDTPRIDPAFIYHYLNVNSAIIPKKQPPRHPSKGHANAIRDEVAKLKCAGAIKEVFCVELLANTVVVKKKSGK